MERRSCVRHNIKRKVVFRTGENSKKKMAVRSFNISRGGMGLVLNNLIETTGKVYLELFDPRDRMPLKGEGKVVWQSQDPVSNEILAGIQFSSIPWTRLGTMIEDQN